MDLALLQQVPFPPLTALPITGALKQPVHVTLENALLPPKKQHARQLTQQQHAMEPPSFANNKPALPTVTVIPTYAPPLLPAPTASPALIPLPARLLPPVVMPLITVMLLHQFASQKLAQVPHLFQWLMLTVV